MVWRKYPRYQKSKNVLKNLKDLSIPELKKVIKSLNTYNEKYMNHARECKNIERENLNATRTLDIKRDRLSSLVGEYTRKSFDQYNSRLLGHELGFFEGLVDSVDAGNGNKFPSRLRSEVALWKQYVETYERYNEEVNKVISEINQIQKPIPSFKKYDPYISIKGIKIRVETKVWSVDTVRKELDQRLLHEDQKREEVNKLKARVVDKEEEKRKQANKYRDIESQIKKLNCCPYCGVTLYKTDAHLDHIYPISKGGLSVKSNLVFVCTKCNLSKSNSTLRNFIRKEKLDENLVYERLEILKKDF